MALPSYERKGIERLSCSSACQKVTVYTIDGMRRKLIDIHDPVSHEEFARAALGGGERDAWVFRSGSLVIDRWMRSVTSEGKSIRLTLTEWKILELLARYPGRILTSREIEQEVWDAEQCYDRGKVVRINMGRIRPKLGKNKRLLKSVLYRGYVLLEEPPIEVTGEHGAD